MFGSDGEVDRYLDTRDEDKCNWMCLVPPSSESQLQNLACIQVSPTGLLEFGSPSSDLV